MLYTLDQEQASDVSIVRRNLLTGEQFAIVALIRKQNVTANRQQC